MKITIEQLNRIMDANEGFLDLSGSAIAKLPNNLTVGNWLDLSDSAITELPDNLAVGGWLDLSGTAVTELPDNLIIDYSAIIKNPTA